MGACPREAKEGAHGRLIRAHLRREKKDSDQVTAVRAIERNRSTPEGRTKGGRKTRRGGTWKAGNLAERGRQEMEHVEIQIPNRRGR